MKRTSQLVYGLLSTLLLLTSCTSGDNPAAQASGDAAKLDLIQLYPYADQHRETGIINLSTPYSTYYLHQGWTHPYDPEEGQVARVVATKPECLLRYNVIRPHDRWLIFSARSQGKEGGPRHQELEIFAGEQSLGRFDLTPEETEYQVFIPENVQRRGANMLTFRFAILSENPNFLTTRKKHEDFPFPSVAAYFSALKIKLGDENEPMYYETPDETGNFHLVADGKYLAQGVPSALSYAFEMTAGAELRFEGTAQSVTGDPEAVTVSILARTDENPEFETLWEQTIEFGAGTATDTFEGTVELGEYAGSPAEVRISAVTDRLIPQTGIVWRTLELSLPGAHKQQQTVKVERPKNIRNVVFVVLDAARARNFGVYGSDLQATENIDAFARDALVFTNAVAPAPYTIASISSLFSGLLPEAHGVRKITQQFPDELESMPKAFKRSGYFTLTLSGTKFIDPTYGLTDECDLTLTLRQERYKDKSVTTMDVEAMREGIRTAAESGKPVFIYAHFLPPHWPYRPPEPWDKFYTTGKKVTWRNAWQVKSLLEHHIIAPDDEDLLTYQRRYYNNLRYADHVVRQLFDLLKEYDLYDDSLIVVTADHGEALGEHREFGHNTSVYEEMIHIPMIIRVPGVEARTIDQQIGLIDFFQTFTEMLNLRTEKVPFQGRSIAPLIMGGEQPGGDYYYSRAFYATKLYFMMRGQRMKYVQNDHDGHLFDLAEDPGEQSDVIDRHPVLAQMLRQRALIMIAANEAMSGGGKDVSLSDEDEEELRDLGYIQ